MSAQVLTDQDFKQEVEQSKGVVLVDFWAPWCGPCKIQGPIADELSEEIKDVKIAKLNVDENQASASQFGVMSIPTIIIFKEGKPVETLVGLQQKDNLKSKLEAAIK
ncbi:thioredoxin [bacterium]|jgi:thioredoxin 1|nr:thioredoxin [bacterium]MDP6571374.1 thioredoxin [Patescibacteria group bacterium]|tara:strand:+ start:9708 stop:10028 length:321 start_codon:yes stop_codon:yes gene_type:complete